MQIHKIAIHNFRSIKDVSFILGNYSMLVGANNSGKSNIIDAVRLFYDKYKYVENDFNKSATDKEVWIEIEYQLTDEEFLDLKEEWRLLDNRLKIRKYIKTEEKDDKGKNKTGFYSYNADGKIANSLFYGSNSVALGKLGDVVYIPAQSSIEEQMKLSGSSPFRDLITNILERVIEGNAAYGDLKNDLFKFSSYIKEAQTEDQKSLMQLQNEISAELSDWNTKFEFDFKTLDINTIIKNLISYKISESFENMDASQMGSGFQRQLIYTLIGIGARYPSNKKEKKDKDFTPNMTLILFEEPEAFLHPSQQNILSSNLKYLSRKNAQILISTHSPHFVSSNVNDLVSIIKIKKNEKESLIYQLTKEKLQEVFESNRKLPGIVDSSVEDYEIEEIQYFLWLNAERSGMFFAKRVVLVEGPSESVLFNYLMDKQEVPQPKGGAFFLDCMGKINMNRFMNLLGNLGIDHSVLFDEDENLPKKEINHLLLNSFIKEQKNKYTKQIKTFKKDLENELGIEAPKQNYKKPQYILYNWLNNKINEENKEKLKQILKDLLS